MGNESPRSSKRNLWGLAAVMLSLILLGICVAIAHHFANRALQNKPVDVFSQLWAKNLGTLAATIVKVCFTFTVGLAFQEALWQSLRRRPTKISSIDKLFTVETNLLGFLSWDALKTAPLPLVLATIAWTIPILPIITPGTLAVDNLTVPGSVACQVRNFTGERSQESSFTNPYGFFQTNPTDDHLIGPSEELNMTAVKTFVRGEILPSPSPCGVNCTFKTSFGAPAFNCSDQDNPPLSNRMPLYNGSIGNTRNIYPTGLNITYFNVYDNNITKKYEFGQDPAAGGVRSLACQAYEATYEVNVTYTNNVPTYNATILAYHDELQTLNASEQSTPGSYFRHTNMAMLASMTIGYLSGEVNASNSFDSTTSRIQTTALANSQATRDGYSRSRLFVVQRDLATAIPELLANLTLSTMAEDRNGTNTTCTTYTTFPAYTYDAFWLLFPYAVATALALAGASAGALAVYQTGIRTGDLFSQVLVATRNPALDALARGHSLSSRGAKDLAGERVVLGELRGPPADGGAAGGAGSGHAAFGLAHQTVRLWRGVAYA